MKRRNFIGLLAIPFLGKPKTDSDLILWEDRYNFTKGGYTGSGWDKDDYALNLKGIYNDRAQMWLKKNQQ